MLQHRHGYPLKHLPWKAITSDRATGCYRSAPLLSTIYKLN